MHLWLCLIQRSLEIIKKEIKTVTDFNPSWFVFSSSGSPPAIVSWSRACAAFSFCMKTSFWLNPSVNICIKLCVLRWCRYNNKQWMWCLVSAIRPEVCYTLHDRLKQIKPWTLTGDIFIHRASNKSILRL